MSFKKHITKLLTIPEELVKSTSLTDKEKCLYIVLCSLSDEDGSDVDFNEVCHITKHSRKTINKYLHHLIISGWITYSKEKGYTLNLEAKKGGE